MITKDMGQLSNKLENINLELLYLLNERAKLVKQVNDANDVQKLECIDPFREQYMLDKMLKQNQGPFETDTIKQLFKDIFKADSTLLEEDNGTVLRVSRKSKPEDTIIDIKSEIIGDGCCHFFMGPCAIESYEQVAAVAETLKRNGLTLLRGGAFKPRTSPYDFQGLGMDGLKILKKVAEEYDLAVVSEIVNPSHLEMAADFLDVVQIGARNMQNFELLKAAGDIGRPILLKRGMTATINEFINAAEYIMSRGNGNIILCERGIRTFSQATRNTLDISSVPILKQETHLPVIVDVTHSTGRRDLLTPTAKAAIAIGADGIMAEVHPNPAIALSDSTQQMDIPMFENFINELTSFSQFHTEA